MLTLLSATKRATARCLASLTCIILNVLVKPWPSFSASKKNAWVVAKWEALWEKVAVLVAKLWTQGPGVPEVSYSTPKSGGFQNKVPHSIGLIEKEIRAVLLEVWTLHAFLKHHLPSSVFPTGRQTFSKAPFLKKPTNPQTIVYENDQQVCNFNTGPSLPRWELAQWLFKTWGDTWSEKKGSEKAP